MNRYLCLQISTSFAVEMIWRVHMLHPMAYADACVEGTEWMITMFGTPPKSLPDDHNPLLPKTPIGESPKIKQEREVVAFRASKRPWGRQAAQRGGPVFVVGVRYPSRSRASWA